MKKYRRLKIRPLHARVSPLPFQTLLLLVIVTLSVLAPRLTCAEGTEPAGSGGTLVTPRVYHSATRLLDGRVLLAAGYDLNSQVTNSVELYDPARNKWNATGSLNTARYLHAAALLLDGRVLVTAGETPSGLVFKSTELYNPATGTWSYTADMFLGRINSDAVTLADGRVLVAGGATPSFQTAEAELYDPATGAWSVTGSLVHERSSHHSTLLADGRVLIAGGFNQSGSVLEGELYDPVSGTFTATGSLLFERYLNSQTLLADGRVLCAGGTQNSGHKFKALASAEIYDPATGVWTRTGSMRVGRGGFTANLLADGKVFVAGGIGSSIQLLDSIEEYNPTSGQWRPFSSTLAHARDFHTTTPLLDGSLIVAGGGLPGLQVAEAELFVRPR